MKRMGHHEMNDFMSAIPILETHEQRLGIEVSSFPHMSKKDQDKLMNSINRRGQLEDQKELTSQELAEALGFI